jgi:polyferredoxin
MNAVAGRIWCGYLCPQTVWTDLFFAIERSSRATGASICSATSAMDGRHLRTQGLKHFLWLMVAWWTGGAWVFISPMRRPW